MAGLLYALAMWSVIGSTPGHDDTFQPSETFAESGPYFVFFGFDSSEIDRDGHDILKRAVDEYRVSGATKVVLTGHTDRSGASSYNQRLSKRRVEAVRRQLEDLGVSGSSIEVGPDGEGQPLIETADGVREAQNRRVEIHFE